MREKETEGGREGEGGEKVENQEQSVGLSSSVRPFFLLFGRRPRSPVGGWVGVGDATAKAFELPSTASNLLWLLLSVGRNKQPAEQSRAEQSSHTVFSPAEQKVTPIPRDRGSNAMLVTEVLSHPLTSQTERAWLGAKK